MFFHTADDKDYLTVGCFLLLAVSPQAGRPPPPPSNWLSAPALLSQAPQPPPTPQPQVRGLKAKGHVIQYQLTTFDLPCRGGANLACKKLLNSGAEDNRETLESFF